ncbi:1113_t:CDS:1 [Funneliformis geosporum]|uniref:594_t:CDS:1 n=1 Tax=Funneliformis geosporum TaxID=1117311 RepID=A0A9W4SLU1_9GLOM|nr:1113_t:CDS:1 [Funneliformis geosporum]CAI2174142.1 594_t:CDS:1 [Funneliformis geosporum]
MVLVNVQNSRIGACLNLPYDFYYNVEELKKLFPNVNFITQDDFLSWTKERHEKPDVVLRRIQQGGEPNTIISNVGLQEWGNVINNQCLEKFDFKFDNQNVSLYKKIQIGPKKYWRKNNEAMTKFIFSNLEHINEEVLLIHPNEVGGALFPSKGEIIPLPYAAHMIEAAKNVTNHLKPYIGIHWRQETIKPRVLPNCAKGLIKYINELKLKTGIENIYYATDYPLYNGTQSSTFHVLAREHHESMRMLNSAFTLNTWVSLKALDGLYDIFPQFKKYITEELNGSGIQGILDKLVLIDADYFIIGPHGCARTSSNFTKKVYLARKLLLESGNKDIHNDIDHW